MASINLATVLMPRPRPVLNGFVLKKGSVILSIMSTGIPQPSSVMDIKRYFPGTKSWLIDSVLPCASIRTFRVILPSPEIASLELAPKFSKIEDTSESSNQQVSSVCSMWVLTLMSFEHTLRSMFAFFAVNLATLTSSGCGTYSDEKLPICCVNFLLSLQAPTASSNASI